VIINYVHFSAPDEMRSFDTEKARKNGPAFFGTDHRSPEEYAQLSLRKFEEDKAKGYILYYHIKEE